MSLTKMGTKVVLTQRQLDALLYAVTVALDADPTSVYATDLAEMKAAAGGVVRITARLV